MATILSASEWTAEIHFCDPPERIKQCLNCTRDRCDHGTCTRVDRSRKGGGILVQINEAEFRRLYDQGLTDAKIAAALQISHNATFRYRTKLQLPPNGWRPKKKKE